MPPWPTIDLMKNFTKSNDVGCGTFHVPSSVGMTNFPMFPSINNNYYYTPPQYQVPTTIVQYHGNVNINYNYGTGSSDSKCKNTKMSISPTPTKKPYNPYKMSKATACTKKPHNPYKSKPKVQQNIRKKTVEKPIVTPLKNPYLRRPTIGKHSNNNTDLNYHSIYNQVDEEELCRLVGIEECFDSYYDSILESEILRVLKEVEGSYESFCEYQDEQLQEELDNETFSLQSHFSDDTFDTRYQ